MGAFSSDHVWVEKENIFYYRRALLHLPAIVPPVPVENVIASTLPCVCSHISGPVVSKCALLLAVLSNYVQ